MPQRFNGKLMRKLRREAELDVVELADTIEKTTGRRWHRDHLYGIEAESRQPGLKLSHAIADALGVPWDRLWISDGDTAQGPRRRQAARA